MNNFDNINRTLDRLKFFVREFDKNQVTQAVNAQKLIPELKTRVMELESYLECKLINADYTVKAPQPTQFLDGSAYLSHVERVRKARGAEVPQSYYTDPLMYQAVSDFFYPAESSIPVYPEEYGLDFEVEIGIFTDAVKMGVSEVEASELIKGVVIINDISLRGLIPNELAKGFGFVQGKPHSAISDIMIPIQQLGEFWVDDKFTAPIEVYFNDIEMTLFPEIGMNFNFAELIVHAAKTRSLPENTLIGSGTISNNNDNYGCIVEQRVSNPDNMWDYMKDGDVISVEVADFPELNIKQTVEEK